MFLSPSQLKGSQEESVTRDCLEGVRFGKKRKADRVQGKKKVGSATRLSGILRELRQGRASPSSQPAGLYWLGDETGEFAVKKRNECEDGIPDSQACPSQVKSAGIRGTGS